ncbi:MAG: hypothetical protein ACLQFR_27190 [Streptosporangiaceae bacterium]
MPSAASAMAKAATGAPVRPLTCTVLAVSCGGSASWDALAADGLADGSVVGSLAEVARACGRAARVGAGTWA